MTEPHQQEQPPPPPPAPPVVAPEDEIPMITPTIDDATTASAPPSAPVIPALPPSAVVETNEGEMNPMHPPLPTQLPPQPPQDVSTEPPATNVVIAASAEETAPVPVAAAAPMEATAPVEATAPGVTVPGARKKRLCRFPGCQRVIKSQGHCQRHGARAKRCKVEGCDKQAQGTHDGMCKRHWKAIHCPEQLTTKQDIKPPPPEGKSVYDGVLPQSIAYRPNHSHKQAAAAAAEAASTAGRSVEDPPPPPQNAVVMPLVTFLREGAIREAGWHRNAERRARGLFPITTLSSQLEPWERQLALVEILLLSGGTLYANFRDLAHAWGREKGFHHVLATSICERRGEVERKRRSDAGKTLSIEQKESNRKKMKRTRTAAEANKNNVGTVAAGMAAPVSVAPAPIPLIPPGPPETCTVIPNQSPVVETMAPVGTTVLPGVPVAMQTEDSAVDGVVGALAAPPTDLGAADDEIEV